MKRFLAVLACTPALALAQAFPSKPIHIVNQFNAGASGDTTSRLVAGEVSKIVGQPVVVENRPGGAGMVAAAYVAKSEPDGYTLLNSTSGLITLKFLSKTIEFDPMEMLTPLVRIGQPIVCFVVNTKHPAAGSLRDLIEFAKRNPGKVTYGTSGIGSPHHMAGEQIRLLTGAPLVHVPYKASAAALTDTVAGQIASTFSIYAVTLTHIESGRVRPLAVVRDGRVKQLPDVPTMAELIPGFDEPPSWTGMFAPRRIPAALLRRLNADFVKALNSQDLRAKMEPSGTEVLPGTPEEFAELIRRGTAVTAKIVKEAGIKPR
jgi:tripartite-type tricarboxylate transporter receptor subunit TctC